MYLYCTFQSDYVKDIFKRNTPAGIFCQAQNECLEKNCDPAAIYHHDCKEKNADCQQMSGSQPVIILGP